MKKSLLFSRTNLFLAPSDDSDRHRHCQTDGGQEDIKKSADLRHPELTPAAPRSLRGLLRINTRLDCVLHSSLSLERERSVQLGHLWLARVKVKISVLLMFKIENISF